MAIDMPPSVIQCQLFRQEDGDIRPFRWELGHRAIYTTHWLNFGPFFIQWKLRSW
jgi:hypothetical protein